MKVFKPQTVKLFKPQTINQFKIHQFLVDEGLQPQAVANVSFPTRDSVRITDPQNSTMTVQRTEPGVYVFTYCIDGETSNETRTDPAEIRDEACLR